MREILFRGKRLDNGEWMTGDLRHWNKEQVGIHHEALHRTMRVDPATVGQYTGFTDKNGKKIFEGDILKYGDRTGYVRYNNGCFSVKDICSLNSPAIDIVMVEFDVEVIGNIHDNPELMEG